jgi:sulfur carrier protein ThiS
MRQATPDENLMTVSIARFGQSTLTLEVPVDSTVQDVLDSAGIDTQGNEQLFVAGTNANANDILDAGDILSIVTPKQAGTN